jgi:hypothetical protein
MSLASESLIRRHKLTLFGFMFSVRSLGEARRPHTWVCAVMVVCDCIDRRRSAESERGDFYFARHMRVTNKLVPYTGSPLGEYGVRDRN